MAEPATTIEDRVASVRSPGTKLATLIAVCVSVFMLPLDYTVVVVALRDIQSELQASYADLQWVVNGYTLTFGAFLLAGVGLADLFGRRRILLIGIGVFALSLLGCGLAPSALVLNCAPSCRRAHGGQEQALRAAAEQRPFLTAAPRAGSSNTWVGTEGWAPLGTNKRMLPWGPFVRRSGVPVASRLTPAAPHTRG